uniref:hypothetical protein n=1 Tax=Acidithiobacillus sp. TaxID=1872118 RepID=UPI00258C3503
MADQWGMNDEIVKTPSTPDFGVNDEIDQHNPLKRGWNKMKQSVGLTTDLATGDYKGAAEGVAEADTYQRQNPGSPEGKAMMQAWQRGDGISGGLEEVGKQFSKDWNAAPTGLGAIRSVTKNVQAMGSGVLEQTPNMVAPMGAMLAGSALGSVAGSQVPVVGTAIGGAAGMWAGATLGNAAVEGGGMAQEALQAAGINPQDKAATEAYLSQNGDKLLGQAGVKGGIIGAVDTLTMRLGHGLLTGPAKAASERAIKELGLDVTDAAAVKAASGQIAAKVAADPIYKAATSGTGGAARNVGVAAMEPAGEFAGEYAGQGVATGNWDEKNAFLEAASSIGQGAATFAGQKLYANAKAPFGKADPIVEPAAELEQVPAGTTPPVEHVPVDQAITPPAAPVSPAAAVEHVPVAPPAEPAKPSESMGLTPTAAPSLTNAAILAVDSGVSQKASSAFDQREADRPQMIDGDIATTASGAPLTNRIMAGKAAKSMSAETGQPWQPIELGAKQFVIRQVVQDGTVDAIPPAVDTSVPGAANQPDGSMDAGVVDPVGLATEPSGTVAADVGQTGGLPGGTADAAVTPIAEPVEDAGVGKKQVFNIGGRDPHTATFEHKDDGRLVRTITYPDGQSNTETLVTDRNGDELWVSQSAYEKGEFYPAQLSGPEASTAIRDDIAGKDAEPAPVEAPPVTQPAQPGTTGEGAGGSQPTQAAPTKKEQAKADTDHLFGVDQKRAKAIERIAKGTAYFSNGLKAQQFIVQNGLKDTHQAVKTNDKRWDVQAKSQPTEQPSAQTDQAQPQQTQQQA